MSGAALEIEDESPLLAFLRERFDEPLLDSALTRPLREFLARPGKGVRARLVAVAWELAGGRGEPPPQLPLAIELLHAGSLIVDDIEDGSTERRGAPALHVRAGLPTALNAANWLYFAAMELVGMLPLDERRALHALQRTNALLLRCHEGQALDVGVRVSTLRQEEVEGIAHAIAERKTGGLAALGTTLAAICAHAPPHTERALEEFGGSIGVALQLLDDAGAVCCDDRCAKGEEDLRNGRATWAWALAAREADAATYRMLRRLARDVEQGTGDPAALRGALRPFVAGAWRSAARAVLRDALARLRAVVGECRAVHEAAAIAHALEHSYG